MSDLTEVRVKLAHMRGTQIAGPSGTLYMVHAHTGQMHAMKQGTPAADPGCLPQDAEEFRQFGTYEVAGASPPAAAPQAPPPPPPRPVSGAAGSAKEPESPTAPPVASATLDAELGPRGRLVALGREGWLKNAADRGIPEAEDMTDDDIVTAIMLASGYPEDVAMGTNIVDPATLAMRNPLEGVPAEVTELTTKEWINFAAEKGVPLNSRDRKTRQSIRDAIVTHLTPE